MASTARFGTTLTSFLFRFTKPRILPIHRRHRGSNVPATDNVAEELFPQRMTLPEDYGYVPMLSPAQVTAILSVYESASVEGTQTDKKPSAVKSFHSNQLPSNSPIEDRRSVGSLMRSSGELFAVIDGHGGSACAQAVSERLLEYIGVSLLPPDQLADYHNSTRSDFLPALVNHHRFRETYFNDDLANVFNQSLLKFVNETLSVSGLEEGETAPTIFSKLKTAFLRLDSDISSEAMPVGGVYDEDLLQIALSGSCACAVHIDGIKVHVANVGDCRAVLGSINPETGAWQARALSVDHNVDSEAESTRVKQSHPQSEANNLFKNARLLGQLIPLRAFGDVRFKWSEKDLRTLAASLAGKLSQNIVPANYQTPPYLICRPQVMNFELNKSDRFIIIASDGLWELMNNERAVEIVGDHLVGISMRDRFVRENYGALTLGEINTVLRDRQRGLAYRSSDVNGATHLVRHAIGFEHRKVSEMLTLPAGMSRFYRDDITVVVIYLDPGYLSHHTPSGK